MSDNWSASVVTLAAPGDWVEWEVTLDSDAADALNDVAGDHEAAVGARGAALSDPDVTPAAVFWIFVNNRWTAGLNGTFNSSTSPPWNDPGRFVNYNPLNAPSVLNYWCPPFLPPRGVDGSVPNYFDGVSNGPYPDDPLWVPGTNVIRVVNYGFDGADGEPIDIDALFITTGDGMNFGGLPYSAEAKPADYDAHVDGDVGGDTVQRLTGNEIARLWICKAPDGATGSYSGATTIDVQKFCNPGDTTKIKIFVNIDGAPADGEVDIFQNGGGFASTIARITLVDGLAEFEGDSTSSLEGGLSGVRPLTVISYGGSPDGTFSPAYLSTSDIPTVGCGGWHVGSIGMGR